MQKMELAWGFGQDTGIDLPAESTGTIPTRQWLYYLWKDNAYTGQDWCKHGTPVRLLRPADRVPGLPERLQWEPGQAAIAAIGQGYVTVTPLQLADAYAALANGGTLYSPRIGEALVSPITGQVVQRINPPVVRHLPVSGYTLSYIRSALAGVVTQGTAAGAFGGFPLSKVCVAGKTGTAELFGENATSVFASFAPCNNPKYVVLVMVPDSGYGADVAAPAVRQIWDGIYGLEGHKAAVPGGQVPSVAAADLLDRDDHRAVRLHQGEVMLGRTTSYTARGLTTRGRGCSPPAARGPCWPGRSPGTPRCGTWTGCWSWSCSG